MKREIHLDRVELDGFAVRRRSATMRWESGEPHSVEPGHGRHAFVACASLPTRYQAGPKRVQLDATFPNGRTVSIAAVIVERRDDAYGTVVVLADPPA